MQLFLQGKVNYRNTYKKRALFIYEAKLRISDKITYSDLADLHKKYAPDIEEREFAKYYLDISSRVYYLLQSKKIKQTSILGREYVSQDGIELISQRVKEFLKQDNITRINYDLLSYLYEIYGGRLDIKSFGEEILGISANSVKNLKSDRKKEAILFSNTMMKRNEIKRRQDRVIKNEHLHIGDTITLEELDRLYSIYADGLSHQDFSCKVLQITVGQYGRLKRGAYPEVTMLEQYYVSPDEFYRLRKIVIESEGLKIQEQISLQRFQELYKKYGGPLSEVMFAEEILGMNPKGISNMKRTDAKPYVLADVKVPEEYILAVRKKIMQEKNLKPREPITIEKIREYHQEYAPILPENYFATRVLDIPYNNYLSVRTQRNTTEALTSLEVKEPDFQAIRKRIIREKGLHYCDYISYETLHNWHQEYAPEAPERAFSENALDVSKSALNKLRNGTSNGTYILKKEPLPELKRINSLRLEIAKKYKLHIRDMIDYGTFLKIYKAYGDILPDYMFAENVLKIKREQLREIKRDPERKVLVFNQIEVTTREIDRVKNVVFSDLNAVYGQTISANQFYELYDKSKTILTPIQFSERILGISKRRYHVMMQKCTLNVDEIKAALLYGLTDQEMASKFRLPKGIVKAKIDKLVKDGKLSIDEIESERQLKEAAGLLKRKVIPGFANQNAAQFQSQKRQAEADKLRKASNKILDVFDFDDENVKKVREYIDNCFERVRFEEFPEEELGDLEESLYFLQVGEKDITEYVKACVSFGKYRRAIGFITNSIDNPNVDDEARERLEKLQASVRYAMKKANVVNLIFSGEKDTSVISRKTGVLEVDIIDIYNRWNHVRNNYSREEEVG